MQLIEEFSALSHVVSEGALSAAASRFIGELEFERYELQLVTGAVDGQAEKWKTVGNVPDGYGPLWHRSGATCPVMQHAKKSSLPLYWGQKTYERAEEMHRWDEQTPWGYGTGFIVAAHLQSDKHVVIAVEREKALRDSGSQLTHKFALFQLFATCALDACIAVMSEEKALLSVECPLTARELETLKWTLAGKTAWEVGSILGITQGTASLHVHNAAKKLGAVNKHHAARIAARLGWIK